MNTAEFCTPNEVLFMASAMAGDQEYKFVPRGFYLALIQEAFRELNMESLFAEKRADFDFPHDTLTLALPDDCFNVENVYIFSGTTCEISRSRKVWWKKNYYTTGNGYIANDKGVNNNDPFFPSRNLSSKTPGEKWDKTLVRYDNRDSVNNVLYYNLQGSSIMFSSSCRNAGNRVHIHYRGTGGKIYEAPIIPTFFKVAIEDYVIEAALRFRMANEPSNAKLWAYNQALYAKRSDRYGMSGSWHEAVMRSRTMNKSQRDELATYLGRAAWAAGR